MASVPVFSSPHETAPPPSPITRQRMWVRVGICSLPTAGPSHASARYCSRRVPNRLPPNKLARGRPRVGGGDATNGCSPGGSRVVVGEPAGHPICRLVPRRRRRRPSQSTSLWGGRRPQSVGGRGTAAVAADRGSVAPSRGGCAGAADRGRADGRVEGGGVCEGGARERPSKEGAPAAEQPAPAPPVPPVPLLAASTCVRGAAAWASAAPAAPSGPRPRYRCVHGVQAVGARRRPAVSVGVCVGDGGAGTGVGRYIETGVVSWPVARLRVPVPVRQGRSLPQAVEDGHRRRCETQPLLGSGGGGGGRDECVAVRACGGVVSPPTARRPPACYRRGPFPRAPLPLHFPSPSASWTPWYRPLRAFVPARVAGCHGHGDRWWLRRRL